MKNHFVGFHLDFIGFGASILCAVHCAALPFLVSFAPLAGFHFLDDPWVEYSIILLSFFIASYALVQGYRSYHHKPQALITVVVGFILIIMGHFFQSEWKEVILTSCGAVVVSIAHFINWRQIRRSHSTFNKGCMHPKEP